jgi:tRNA A-37 threonylcarbamoyl transferase component Bud32
MKTKVDKYNFSFGEGSREILAALFDFAVCERPDGSRYGIAAGKQCRKGREVDIENASWEYLTKGNYGSVEIDRKQGLIRKTNIEGRDFGEHEAKLQRMMGDAGFSPKLHRANDREIVMDLAPGKTIWKGYRPTESEAGVKFNEQQANNAAKAILFLHRKGFSHGDMHSLQWMVEGDKPMLLDFGLAKRAADDPRKAMQDWTKGAKFLNLDAIGGEAGERIRDFVQRYKEAGPATTPIKQRVPKETKVAREYLAWIDSL